MFGLAFARVPELPGKLRLSGPEWLTVQHNLYIGFGRFAAVVAAECLTMGPPLHRTRLDGFRMRSR
jgi:hypothetical protein